MYVVKFFFQLKLGNDVAVVSTAVLPKSNLALRRAELCQDRGIEFIPSADNHFRKISLESPNDLRDRCSLDVRPDEQVHMFGHDDPGDEMEVRVYACVVYVIDKRVFDAVVVEERELLVTGESEESDVVGRFDSLHLRRA